MKSDALALVVMSQERRLPLLANLKKLNLDVLTVANCQQARALLATRPPVEVIITGVTLADGNWRDIFKCLADRDLDASVVVSSVPADENLWSEILWRGAYDLLVEPYEKGEVRRIVEGALRAARARRTATQRRQRAAAGGRAWTSSA